MGIEPTRPAWKAGILTIELHPLIFRATLIIIYNCLEKVKHFPEIYRNKSEVFYLHKMTGRSQENQDCGFTFKENRL